MKTYPPRPRPAIRSLPAFTPVPLRARADGWTPERQARFLGALAETGSVEAAARKVGMARESAYRLRRRPCAESFAAAWDAALDRDGDGHRKFTLEELERRALHGVLRLRFYAGQHVATEHRGDNSALLSLLRQRTRARRRGPHAGPKVTRDEA